MASGVAPLPSMNMAGKTKGPRAMKLDWELCTESTNRMFVKELKSGKKRWGKELFCTSRPLPLFPLVSLSQVSYACDSYSLKGNWLIIYFLITRKNGSKFSKWDLLSLIIFLCAEVEINYDIMLMRPGCSITIRSWLPKKRKWRFWGETVRNEPGGKMEKGLIYFGCRPNFR